MQINLNNIYPSFFDASTIASSAVWRQPLLFNKGKRIHIIAPSGSGKTSFIHFLYNLRRDYTGTILFDGANTKTFTAAQTARWRQQHISIVFQDLRLFPEQTVEQNLEIKRLLQPFHPQSRIKDMARSLGIESKLNSVCKTCSYGEQQRIAIIRALQQPFDFLLLDEPFSHLDETNRMKAMELIDAEVAERNAAVIFADLKQIEYFKADMILNM